MLTYSDLLRRTKTDLKHWEELIKANPDLTDTYPEHTEELKLEIKALEIADQRERKG